MKKWIFVISLGILSVGCHKHLEGANTSSEDNAQKKCNCKKKGSDISDIKPDNTILPSY